MHGAGGIKDSIKDFWQGPKHTSVKYAEERRRKRKYVMKQPPEVFYKKAVLKNYTKFTEHY